MKRNARVGERPFLGYRLWEDGTLAVASHSLERGKVKVRQMTRRMRGGESGTGET